jgi:hypothetical protein
VAAAASAALAAALVKKDTLIHASQRALGAASYVLSAGLGLGFGLLGSLGGSQRGIKSLLDFLNHLLGLLNLLFALKSKKESKLVHCYTINGEPQKRTLELSPWGLATNSETDFLYLKRRYSKRAIRLLKSCEVDGCAPSATRSSSHVWNTHQIDGLQLFTKLLNSFGLLDLLQETVGVELVLFLQETTQNIRF